MLIIVINGNVKPAIRNDEELNKLMEDLKSRCQEHQEVQDSGSTQDPRFLSASPANIKSVRKVAKNIKSQKNIIHSKET